MNRDLLLPNGILWHIKEPSTTWQNVAEKVLRRMNFLSTDEAFRWFCEQGSDEPCRGS